MCPACVEYDCGCGGSACFVCDFECSTWLNGGANLKGNEDETTREVESGEGGGGWSKTWNKRDRRRKGGT